MPATFTSDGIHLAYAVSGHGPPLILLHGWPFHRASFRRLLPYLEPHYTCYAPDSAGMGESEWDARTDFSQPAHARRAIAFADHAGLDRFALLGHDTGATIARLVAAAEPERVRKLVVLDTECPNHRPPFVEATQRMVGSALGRAALRWAFGSQAFLRSKSGFGGCFANADLIDREFEELFVAPLRRSPERLRGASAYLRGIEWKLIDGLDAVHAGIRAPMLFVWGADDPIFPREIGEAMARRAPTFAGFEAIEGTRFLLHEERPGEVAERVLAFLAD